MIKVLVSLSLIWLFSDNEDLTSIPSISVASDDDDDDIMVVDSNTSSYTGATSNAVRHVVQLLSFIG